LALCTITNKKGEERDNKRKKNEIRSHNNKFITGQGGKGREEERRNIERRAPRDQHSLSVSLSNLPMLRTVAA
jgi:hypothetical protein